MVHLRRRLARFIKERRGNTPQRDFARKSGLAQSTIMRIENLEQNVTLDTLEQLCKAFHVDVAELFPAAAPARRGSGKAGTAVVYPALTPPPAPANAPAVTVHEKNPAPDKS